MTILLQTLIAAQTCVQSWDRPSYFVKVVTTVTSYLVEESN